MTEALSVPPLNEGTAAAIAQIVDYKIDLEYRRLVDESGNLVETQMRGAEMIAKAGLHFDLRGQFMGMNGGSDRGLDGYVDATLRVLIRKGLEGRLCQCSAINNGLCPHRSVGPCADHYESDVPPIDGALLCGNCHIAEYQARVGEAAKSK